MCEPQAVVVARWQGGTTWVVELQRGTARTRLGIFDGYASARRAAAYKRRVESVLQGRDPGEQTEHLFPDRDDREGSVQPGPPPHRIAGWNVAEEAPR